MFSIFKKFKEGLKRTATGALNALTSLFGKKIDEADIDIIEQTLYSADFGYETANDVIEAIRSEYRKNKELRGKEAMEIGASVLAKILEGSEGDLLENVDSSLPSVVCLVGVNGAGKTTTAAKLAHMLNEKNEGVVLGACDTFRAAANEQIREWANRLDIRLVESAHGADSAATAWDAWQSAKARGSKWLVLDTAGRLHTKENLMNELSKISRVLKKNDVNAPQNAVIVLDGSLGSNSIEQAKAFNKVFPLSGVIITKLDGTSKGGAIAGIYRQLKLPILYVGLGEKPEDLRKFNIQAYVKGVFGLEE
ncbi:MAG: signal recognition particle-docking protein FtsY [Verrucomicrobiaceae bacterium]|nr:signal recognition particle-docking protein FtsY [Verrucomicrobiaceae bacterium]